MSNIKKRGLFFQCTICMKIFPTRKALVIHLMRKHAQKPDYGKDNG